MSIIKQDDFIHSIADALQFISYYHPLDFVQAVGKAWEKEKSPAAKDALAQILMNSRMCAEGHRPICQDTGVVVVFLKIGMTVKFMRVLFQDFLIMMLILNRTTGITWQNPGDLQGD